MVVDEAVAARLRAVRVFLTDVDGVLTDGGVVMGGGFETKRFDIRDGLGLKLLQRSGIRVGFVSARPSAATQERAADLKIDWVRQSSRPKTEVVAELLAELGLGWGDVSFMGDDVLDLGVMRRVGFAAAPGDARPEARRAAHYVSEAPGGRGAVREVVDLLLQAQGKWEPLLAEIAS